MNATSLRSPTLGIGLIGLVGLANAMNATPSARHEHELFFPSLFHEGRGLAFPCDSAGHVDIDTLPHRARINYLSARAMIGRDFGMPQVVLAS